MKTKRIAFFLLLSLLLLCLPVSAKSDSALVTVTICNGAPVLCAEPISVNDRDGDGLLTVNDALICAHDTAYPGEADAGYSAVSSAYGLSLVRLWGEENGGSYGYYVDHASAYSLLTEITDGSVVDAFVYTDTAGFTDTYCYFDVKEQTDGSIKLTLLAASFDENWNPVTLPVAGASILRDNTVIGTTESDGTFTMEAPSEDCVLSAKSDTVNLVPPVLRLAASIPSPATSDLTLSVGICFVFSATACIVCRKRHEDK